MILLRLGLIDNLFQMNNNDHFYQVADSNCSYQEHHILCSLRKITMYPQNNDNVLFIFCNRP